MQENSAIRYSLVIPVFRSGDCLQELARRLVDVLEPLGKNYEVIFVDDASPDKSWDVLNSIVSERPHFKAIQLMRNFGQTQATLCGIKNAIGEVVITLDDDLQHDPSVLPNLLEEFESLGQYDAVFGFFPEKKHHGYRNVASKILLWVNSRAFSGGPQMRLSTLRVMRKEIADVLRANHSRVATIGGMILENTKRISFVAVPHNERYAGKSTYTLSKQIRLALDNIMTVSMLPLRLISLLGFVSSGFSGLLFLFYLIQTISGSIGVAGWPTLVMMITFFSGAILLSLGVIGEYLSRIMREIQALPFTPVRQKLGFNRGISDLHS